jgi:predicted RNA-binding Zn ribbon-like protein
MDAVARDLPEDLVVPLGTGREWWYWLGGRPAVDFVNTLRERWRRRVETLVTPGDLSLWLVQAHLLDAPSRANRALLDDARHLREAIDAGMEAALDGRRTPRPAVSEIDAWLDHGAARPVLALGRDGVPVFEEHGAADPVRRAVASVALDAACMLGTPQERARLRVCASPTCSARFYDRSPAGRRRWCSMSGCGNQAKARRHRARMKIATKEAR